MDRRGFLMSAAALTAVPGLSQAYQAEVFSPTLWRTLRAEQGVVVLNFRASWSLTCQIKADILAELIAAEPSYRQLVFVDVDWDTFGPSVMADRMKVTRNSTLVVTKAGKEVARLEAEPYARKIRALLDQAIAA